MVFRDWEYKRNIKNGVTVFAPVGGFDLGDRIVFEVIRRRYKIDNPDEKIIFPEAVFDPEVVKLKLRPDKFFWSDVSQFAAMPEGCVYYELYQEAEALCEIGWYPAWAVNELPEAGLRRGGGNTVLDRAGEFLNRDFVVLHLRHIKKRAEKNVPIDLARGVFNALMEQKRNIVLLGNDEPYTGMITAFSNVLDLRNKLDLPEVAQVLKKAKLFMGSDSGIAHLAGACSLCPMVVWGLWGEVYRPKVRKDRLRWLLKEDSTVEKVMERVMRKA